MPCCPLAQEEEEGRAQARADAEGVELLRGGHVGHGKKEVVQLIVGIKGGTRRGGRDRDVNGWSSTHTRIREA